MNAITHQAMRAMMKSYGVVDAHRPGGEHWQDIEYDGLQFSVLFESGYPLEIATPNGSDWTNCFQPHIQSIIFSVAQAEWDKQSKADFESGV